ncbi:hypothetical protein SDC9_83160 [bioreactor metagenome]|uniref:Uncharacterized protein n=1 Tax=bioreactor metagenome TaxID=1076179 RepID=A0A644Z994_9ZZZZ
MHWPQLMQLVSTRGFSKAGATCVSKPRLIMPMQATPWVFSQAATQRRQRMHLLLSRTMEGDMSSTLRRMRSPSYLISSTPSSLARVWSSQLWLRLQVRQTRSWSDRIRPSTNLRASRTLAEFVETSIPSDTGMTQEAIILPERLSSTRHIRQAPILLMSFK